MVAVVQLVRASDCGSECRGFESHLPPKEMNRQVFDLKRFGDFSFGVKSCSGLPFETAFTSTFRQLLTNC